MKRPECKLLKASFAIIHANYCANNKAQQQGPKHPIFYTKDFAHLLPMKKNRTFQRTHTKKKRDPDAQIIYDICKKSREQQSSKDNWNNHNSIIIFLCSACRNFFQVTKVRAQTSYIIASIGLLLYDI